MFSRRFRVVRRSGAIRRRCVECAKPQRLRPLSRSEPVVDGPLKGNEGGRLTDLLHYPLYPFLNHSESIACGYSPVPRRVGITSLAHSTFQYQSLLQPIPKSLYLHFFPFSILRLQGKISQITELLWSDGTAYIWDTESEDGEVVHLDKIDLLQSTGVKDRNGKEIYEVYVIDFGSTNHAPRFLASVVFDKSNCAFFIQDGTGARYPLNFAANHDHFEVIGNIYENPQLLK
jgi:uncharacterized phage protein (TIGR01671 family)